MSSNTRHPALEELKSVMAGRLNASEVESVLSHLDTCESCFEKVEQQWTLISPVGGGETLGLDPETARKVEQRLLNDIRRSHLANHAVVFCSKGILLVLLGLLKPMLATVAYLQTEVNGRPL